MKLNVKAGKRIYVNNVDEVLKEIKDVEKNKKTRDIVKYFVDRLRELYSQGLGFLVLYGSEESLDSILGIKIMEKMSLWRRDIPGGRYFGRALQPVRIIVREEPGIYSLANLVWGKIVNFRQVKEDVDLDFYAVMLEEEFYGKIMELASDPSVIVKVEPSKVGEEGLGGETLLHYGVKAFVVKYLN
ncbi:MAG: hypothetical protein DRO09_02500 [Thermoprotei archaeon]|nr:MAG: hypothetical protein DRO09_02500 [Thermoprotei archaeon]